MANNSIFKKHICFMAVFALMVWVPHTKSIKFYTQDDNCIYGYDFEKPRNCSNLGSYVITYNRKDCPARVFCNLDVGAACNPETPETRCAPDLTCMCGSCMNCNVRVCKMELCPKKNGLKRWNSPYEKNWLRLYNQGGDVAETGYYY